MLQPGSGLAIGDSEAKYRVIYRAWVRIHQLNSR